MNKIQKRITCMMQENTGRHMADSGGAYGRHWERNQGQSFEKEPVLFVDLKYQKNGPVEGVCPTLSIFHYLTYFLDATEESEKLNEKYKQLCEEDKDSGYLDLMEQFCDQFQDCWGDGNKPRTTNTYNGDSILSQVLQYTLFDTEKGTFICLQIHGGCDIRGGYTKPQIFEVTEDVHSFLCAQFNISATDGTTTWDSDNGGYSFWATEGCSSSPDGHKSFEEVAMVYEGGVYNRFTGKRISFSNTIGGEDESEHSDISEISEITKFVQEVYNKGENIHQAVKEKFEEMLEFIDISGLINSAIKDIESHTLEIQFQ